MIDRDRDPTDLTDPTGRSEQRGGPLVALTRSAEDNAALGALLEPHGLRWVSAPCVALVEMRPPDALLEALRAGGPFAAIAFPSRRAVEAFLDAPGLIAALDLRPERLLVAAVGPGTARALGERGWPAALVPEERTGAALAAALAAALPVGARVLLPGGDRARPELREGLAARGLSPVPLQVYAHAADSPCPRLPERPSAVVCASPSAAEAFLAAHPRFLDLAFVAIGPTTEAALLGLGAQRVTRARGTETAALADAVLEALHVTPAGSDRSPPERAPAPSNQALSPGRGPQGETP